MKKIIYYLAALVLSLNIVSPTVINAAENGHNHGDENTVEYLVEPRAPICLCGSLTHGELRYTKWVEVDIPCSHEENGYDTVKRRERYYVYVCDSCDTEKEGTHTVEIKVLECHGY